MSDVDPRAERIHRFWFGEVDDWLAVAERNHGRWYERGRELDAEITQRFGEQVEAAGRGELDAWTRSARESVSLVLLLDQFPRHVHMLVRGAAESRQRDEFFTEFDKVLDRRIDAVAEAPGETPE